MGRDGKTNTGYINWPKEDEKWHDTEEGGMWVLAVVRHGDRKDKFITCCTDCLPQLPPPNVVVDDDPRWGDIRSNGEQRFPLEEKFWPNLREWHKKECKGDDVPYSVRFLAVVCLGSSSRSWYDEKRGEHWKCQMSDLTENGVKLVRALERLYGREVELLTFLDT